MAYPECLFAIKRLNSVTGKLFLKKEYHSSERLDKKICWKKNYTIKVEYLFRCWKIP